MRQRLAALLLGTASWLGPFVSASELEPDADELLQRAGRYVADYESDFSAVVAAEEYVQVSTPRRDSVRASTRRLVSDVVWARVSGPIPWTAFRDVLSVDGRPVRDRDERLQKLFIAPTHDSVARARAILDESARFNLGQLPRNINVPTLALLFLHPRNQARFAFQLSGTRKGPGGLRLRGLEFRERSRPTLIHSSAGDDIVSKGIAWVDPASGAVVRTEHTIDPPRIGGGFARVVVEYGFHPEYRVWLPAAMSEVYSSPGEYLTCSARYSGYRRFDVQVEEGWAR